MTPRTGVTAVLLAFVAASVGYLAAGEIRRPSPGAGPSAAASAEPRVIAYYFHATARCPTCLAIEGGARAAIERALPEELATGALEWRSVNVEEPENEHFVTELRITGSSLVLVREEGGRVSRWTNLERVWDLVGDDASFEAYVVESARGFLGGP
jgi:hypothetical protein